MNSKILLVEDDKKLSELLNLQLKYSGYETDVVASGDEALKKISSGVYDLVVMDMMIYGIDGIEVTKRAREFSDIPIIMLTAKSTLNDKLLGFEAGVDDYLTKPFDFPELLVRIKANIRGNLKAKNSIIEYRGITLDVDRYRASKDGRELNLTKNEFKILKLLLDRRGSVVTKEEIINDIWDGYYSEDNNILFVYINYLRAKLGAEKGEKIINNVRGVGYIIK